MTFHNRSRVTLLALTTLLAGCNDKQAYQPLPPLVLASGAGANAQKSIGFATLTGMIDSTLLTVAVVPSLFVVLQQFEARSPDAAAPPLTIELTKFV